MGFGIATFLCQKKISKEQYFKFLEECSSILGEWHIHELAPFNLNSKETVHECFLIDPTDKYAKPKRRVSVWVILDKRDFTKKYGRSRKKINWVIYTETKAGRSFWDLAIQMLIPLKAFEHFSDIVVVVDPEKVFLHPKNYKSFVIDSLVNDYGAEVVAEAGLLDMAEPPALEGLSQ